jgi:alpha-D-xyloside xylohydrolase
VPPEVFKTNDGKPGINAKYYNDNKFQNLTRESVEPQVDAYWYTGRPSYVTDSMYSIRWEGTITAPETGKYQFQIKSFDSRVIIFNGDTLKIQLDCNEPYFEFVEMEKGKEYPIICETQNHQTGAARFRLYWKTPSDFAKEQDTVQREKTREVYLPKGNKWIDFYTGKVYDGGQTVKVDAPIEKIPLLVKQGSILPMGKEIQYADENPFAPMEIRVYQGSDGEFTLYEDAGDNLNYMNSEYSKITFKYSESDKVLTILPREGSFAKMPKSRIFNIAVNPVGTSIAKTVKSVTYTGVQVNIQL